MRASTEWEGWEKDLSDSQPCLSRFMEEHLWKWYLGERSERCAYSLFAFPFLAIGR
jgi:hypothetical protein